MHIEYQLTYDDFREYREHLAAEFAKVYHKKPVSVSELTQLAIVVAIAIAVLLIVFFASDRMPSFVRNISKTTRITESDFIIPIVTAYAINHMTNVYRAIRDKDDRRSAVKKTLRFLKAVIVAFLIIAIWPIIDYLARRSWRPSELASIPVYIIWLLGPHVIWIVNLVSKAMTTARVQTNELELTWQYSKNMHHTNHMDVIDDGLLFEHPSQRAEFRWFGFKKVTESPNLFLLYIDDLMVIPIPKRAFTDDSQCQGFRELLHFNITNRPKAFPVLPIQN